MCAIAMEQELTIAEVAVRLGISVQTVMRRINAGRIKARKEGQEWRVRESDLRRYIDSGYEERHGYKRGAKPIDTDKFQIVIPPPFEQELGR